MAAREAKRLFGQLLDDAQRTPVKIDRHGRTVAVVVSSAEYDRLATYRQHLLSQVAQGGQAPSGEMGELLSEDAQQVAQEELETLLLEGINSGPAEPFDWDEMRREVRERIEGRQHKSA
ncbi:MAG: type II toxin-antitoxin system prevent-host-death family antitoxin [Geminicoccaceae bacterium]